MLAAISRVAFRPAAAGVAFAAAWVVYMVAMVLTVYDGALSLIFQPIAAAVCGAIAVALALLVGLITWIPGIHTIWHRSRIPALLIVLGSLFVLCFGYALGWTDHITDPETQATTTTLHPAALLGGYFALVFAIANFPNPFGSIPTATAVPPPLPTEQKTPPAA